MINKPVYSSTLSGWLDSMGTSQSEKHVVSRVRDSSETIEVILVQKVDEGYTLMGEVEILDPRNSIQAKKMARTTIRLPTELCYPNIIDKTIDELETLNNLYFRDWQDQPWLKGALGVMIDEKGYFKIGCWLLKYTKEMGLSYERE